MWWLPKFADAADAATFLATGLARGVGGVPRAAVRLLWQERARRVGVGHLIACCWRGI
jgi:hypothetical protein